MWLKLIGSICVIAATTGLGYFKGLDYKKQIEELERLKQVIWQLRGEMKYMRIPLDELCRRIARKVEFPYDQWLDGIVTQMRTQESVSFGALWKKETEKLIKDIRLPEETGKELSVLGYQLGYIDIEMQEQAFAWYEKKLEDKRKKLSEKVDEKRKLCNCLGIMSGILFVILIW